MRVNDTNMEATVSAVGVLVGITGIIGLLPGAPSFPGPLWQKLLVAVAGLAIGGIGYLMIWWSGRHKNQRVTNNREQRFAQMRAGRLIQ